jgi:putative transposase
MGRWQIYPGVNLYFITTTIVEWQNVFVSVPAMEIIIDSLKYCCSNKGLHLHGYVIMPNHAHYMVSTDPPERLPDIIRDFNRFTSRKITSLLDELKWLEMLEVFHRAAIDEGRNNRFKVWQEGCRPIGIDSEKFFHQKLNYLHENPVRKGFVEKPEYWQYSSARNYILNDHSVIKVECIE